MRVFLSINWSHGTRLQLENLQDRLKEQGITGYWRRGENLHLTLKFLGEIERTRLESIFAALEPIQGDFRPFLLTLRGLGTFPAKEQPRILWLGTHSQELIWLQSRIETALKSLDLPMDNKPFVPHITLASGGISGLTPQKLRINTVIEETVSQFELMESLVVDQRRVYRTVKKFPLGQ